MSESYRTCRSICRHIGHALLLGILSVSILLSQTGKIAGTITDARTGDPLIAANVLVDGTTLGAATDTDGYFVILGVPPGMYAVRVSMLGYAPYQTVDVRVAIGLTTELNLQLTETVLEGEEIVVVAERPVVAPDVSASRFNLQASEVVTLPVQSVTDVLTLQAGIEQGRDGLVIRGGGTNQTIFAVDGFILNDERSNIPYAAVGLAATREVLVQTGGFTAEYGNVRSGVVNVITREGGIEGYAGTIDLRMRPPAPKHFGISLYDPNSYFNRPYTDPDVAWTGTNNGAWSQEMQSEYPYFQGWNAISEASIQDDDPNNDLTPAGAKRLWEWQRRRQGDIVKPDYVIDAGFGGPVPIIGPMLGNLRFYASHFNEREMFIYPLSRDAFTRHHTQIKLTSELSPNMKLTVMTLYGEEHSVSPYEWTTAPTGYIMRGQYEVANLLSATEGMNALYMPDRYSPSSVYRVTAGAKLTHTLGPKTFYELDVQHYRSRYDTFQQPVRDTSRVFEPIPGIRVDEAPFGYWGFSTGGIDGTMRMGGWMNLGRDASVNTTTSIRFNLTSQLDNVNEVKTGFQFTYDDLNINSGTYSPSMSTWTRSMVYHVYPYRLGVYLQDKLEFQGFIANIGVRLDHSNPNGSYYDLGPYDPLLGSGLGNTLEQAAPRNDAEPETYISPRLGISHPITETSKLYFNYGHFLSEPSSTYRFRLQRESNGLVTYMGNPNMRLEKTVAYELGYEQSLFGTLFLRLAGYYKDVTRQPGWIYYSNINSSVKYYLATNNNYADIRGFEITVSRTTGRWITGFINYTYDVGSSGYFGLTQYWQDVNAQRAYLQQNPYQSKPHPRPYARANISVTTPADFGPDVAGLAPFGAWTFTMLGRWQAGSYATYNPNSIPGLVDNVQWKDSYGVDVRLMKGLRLGAYDVLVYMDVTNVFNFKQLSYAGFSSQYDYQDYLASLCFNWEEGDNQGNDRIGEYRPNGVEYDPLEPNPNNDPAITARNNDRKSRKSYIDMPDITSVTFLNPRSFTFGIRFSF